MDILPDLLRAVRLTGTVFFDHHVQAPFVGGSPPSAAIADQVMPGAEHLIQFHALLSGCCWAALADDALSGIRLDAGDIVIYPMGDGNIISSAPGLRAEPDLLSIAQAATEVGYESEAAFNRAFKKHVGAPPEAWRRGRIPSVKAAMTELG